MLQRDRLARSLFQVGTLTTGSYPQEVDNYTLGTRVRERLTMDLVERLTMDLVKRGLQFARVSGFHDSITHITLAEAESRWPVALLPRIACRQLYCIA